MSVATKTATHTTIAGTYTGRHTGRIIFTRGAWFQYHNGVWSEMHACEIAHEIWNLLEEFEDNDQLRPTASIHRSVQQNTALVPAFSLVLKT